MEPLMAGGMVVVSLAVAIAILIATCNIASNKGYDPTLAFIMGFLFGFWALLVYAILPNRSYAGETGYDSAPRTLPPEPQRSCWSCNAPVTGQVSVCSNCGIRLNY